jgi:single-strand DNA-binding protein
MINKVILLGRLGKDPIIRRLENGRIVANITLATNDYYTKDGQRMESTEWHNLEMWDKQAETAEKYLKKGSLLYVEGKIRTDRYTDAEGQEKQMRKIRVNNFQMMGSMMGDRNNERSDSQANNSASGDSSHAMGNEDNTGMGGMDDDDLPF